MFHSKVDVISQNKFPQKVHMTPNHTPKCPYSITEPITIT